MKVKITNAGKTGTVEFDPEKGVLVVDFPDKNDKEAVEKHLTTKRKFIIPVGGEYEDQTVEEFVIPTESQMYVELALCTLYTRTGIWVNWKESEGLLK